VRINGSMGIGKEINEVNLTNSGVFNMNNVNLELNGVRKIITNKFINNERFLVKVKNSKGEECDNIFLSKEVHELLRKNYCEHSHDKYVFGSVQHDQGKIRLRFYKNRVEEYKGLEKHVLEKFSLKSPYFNSKKSNEAYCFDYSTISLFEKDVDEFLRMFNRLLLFALKKLYENEKR
jgi:hypothetical protein